MVYTTDDLFRAVRALTEELKELERLRNQVRAAEATANAGRRLVERRSTMTPRFENRDGFAAAAPPKSRNVSKSPKPT